MNTNARTPGFGGEMGDLRRAPAVTERDVGLFFLYGYCFSPLCNECNVFSFCSLALWVEGL